MKRSEFKKRMLSLKSYRELNPDKGYWDWRASLPDNLRYTDDTEYDMYSAYKSGALPRLEDDGLYHLPTRDPYTGKILKKSIHPTYFKGLTVDSELGYKPYFFGGETYTWNDQDGVFVPWLKVELFLDGGEKDPRKEYVSPSYKDRYPNILEKLLPYSSIKVRDESSLLLNLFSKADSIIYTPILDRVEKYLLNNDITTDLEKRNAKIVATGIPEVVIGSGALNSGKEWKGLSKGQELINSKVHKLTDSDIKKIFNADILHIGPKEAVKLIPKGLNVVDMFKIGKYVNSDKFRDDYPAATLYADRLRRNNYEWGGEIPPSDYQGSNEPVNVNPFTKKPLANGSITPILDLEDASGFTPIGDILSIRDAYIAAKNRDLLGLGLAGLGFVPFIPTVNRKATQDLMDKAIRQSEKSKLVVDDFYTQRNNVYESMIENEDAFRRAARADRLAGTDYVGTYLLAIRDYLRDPSLYNDNLPSMRFDRDLYSTNIKMQVDPSRPDYITVNPRYKDPDELDDAFKRINPGLVRHEMGHQTDLKAGLLYTDKLADPKKFVSDDKLKEMFPKSYNKFKSTVLNKGSEIKSYMNEFREFLMDKRRWEPKETVKSFRKKLDDYSKEFPTLRMIFDSYKSKSDFIKDYNTVPLTGISKLEGLV